MTQVKICGITNLEDALLSVKFGADALGFNFYEKSPRYISPTKAREIIEQLPPEILKVGVFVNESLEKVVEIAQIAKLDALQLHGEETPEYAKELKLKTNLEIIKAFRVSPKFKPENVLQYETDAILLDAYNSKEHGGTGETFDWEIARKVQEIVYNLYLAGGLSQNNIANAILEVKPFAVDACSCLESEKGKKDKVYLINFLNNVKFSNKEVFRHSDEDDLFYKLRLYRQSPSSYLPEKSITHLCTFIIGYLSALKSTDCEFSQIVNFFNGFDKFVEIRKGTFIHNYYIYSKHFLEKCNNREDRAFDLFFAKFEEFALENEFPTYDKFSTK